MPFLFVLVMPSHASFHTSRIGRPFLRFTTYMMPHYIMRLCLIPDIDAISICPSAPARVHYVATPQALPETGLS